MKQERELARSPAADHASPGAPNPNHEVDATSFSVAEEVLGVAVILLVLVGCGFAGHLRAQARQSERRRDATERFCAEARAQREQLVSAVECYRRALGSYPPDHVVCHEPLVVDVATNQLLYELLGTCYDPVKDAFAAPGFPEIKRSLVRQFFDSTAIKNTTERREQLRHFLDISSVAAVYPAKGSPCPVGLLAAWPNWEGMESDVYQYFEISPWRYNSSAPRHNVGRFDLWVEISTPQTNIVIGNW